ncbi:MAG: hypothetical protein HYY20_05250, partial [Candidatus Tectomicrobia bacterium]|nr:hypothetical protein [Candidatus Tectomicrobia bacterium]
MTQTLTIDELKMRPLEEILQEIVEQQSTIIVLLPNGREVTIEPKPRLKPLPELEGYVPEGWKEAL